MPGKSSTNTVGCMGRRRRIMGWALIGTAAAVLILWLASGVWQFNWTHRSVWVSIGRGRLDMTQAPLAAKGIAAGWDRGFDVWQFDEKRRGFEFRAISQALPSQPGSTVVDGYLFAYVDLGGMRLSTAMLWPVLLFACAAGVLCLRAAATARRRVMDRMCNACGYSLAGLEPDVPCSECGKGPT